jgi:hypothetical protein
VSWVVKTKIARTCSSRGLNIVRSILRCIYHEGSKLWMAWKVVPIRVLF